MKKLNKKGFTLIELLAVLVILAVIMAIAMPSITSSIERSKDKEKKLKIELIESAAELYIDSYQNNTTINKTGQISIKNIICDGKLKAEEAKDPSNENQTLCGYVSYDKSTRVFKWQDSTCTGNYVVKLDSDLNCD